VVHLGLPVADCHARGLLHFALVPKKKKRSALKHFSKWSARLAKTAALVAPSNFSRYRWRICALLFFATTVNYIDRQVIGLLKPALMHDLHPNEIDFGNVQAAFNAAYAVGYACGGWFMDRAGVRRGYAAAVFAWSLAAMSHMFAR